MWRAWLGLALLLVAGDARADPTSIAAFIQAAWGYFVAAAPYIAAAYSVYSGVQARSAAARAERKAKNDYNNSLQERMITAVTEAPPERIVYGDGLYGGDVVAIFTSDAVLEDGTIKKDGLKHLVVVCASHRIKAIKDVQIDGTMLGVTGASGWATSSEFAKGYDEAKVDVFPGTGSTHDVTLESYIGGRYIGTLLPTIISVQASKGDTVLVADVSDYTLVGTTLTLPGALGATTIDSSWGWYVTYSFGSGFVSKVFVSKFLGSDTQTADAYLVGKVPFQWTSTDRLRGRAGAVITLDLTEPRFQGGIPKILFDLEGRDEIFDPRDSTYKYTTNAALCMDDWMRSRWGFGVTPNVAATIVAANACDVATVFTTLTYPSDGIGPPSSSTVTEGRYTMTGSFTAAQDKESVLRDMLAAMAGKAINGAEWVILAGAWTVPVREIVDGDDMGPLQIAQAGAPMDELFNGVRGTFVPYGESATAEINPPYQNSTFVTADGGELWEDLTLPYTDTAPRAANLARIAVEVARNGLTIVYSAKLKHWDLEVGQRVYVTNAEYGFDHKTFQIHNWEFGIDSAVLLTMQEDNEAAYDNADSGLVDPTPNTDLADPNLVPALAGLALAAGTAELILRADGGIEPRLRISWTTSTSPYMDGDAYIELGWQDPYKAPGVWTLRKVSPLESEALVTGVVEGTNVAVRAVVVNSLGRRSVPVFGACYIEGKSAAPAAVAGLSASVVPGAVLVTWTPSTELDYQRTELRYGASYAGGTPLVGVGDDRSYTWPWPVAGTYTIWAVNYDTTKNASTPVSTSVVVDASISTGIKSFYQTTAPTATSIGDIWFDTDDFNKSYWWSGSAWVLARDTGVTTALGKLYTRPNLLVNGGFESGYENWTAVSGFAVSDGLWGRILSSSTTGSGTGFIASDPFEVTAGAGYTITGDSLCFAISGSVYFDMMYYSDPAGTVPVLDGNQNAIGAPHDFSVSDANRDAHAVTTIAPSGAVSARARFVWETLVSCTALGCRMIKVERGGLPATPYSNEAGVAAVFAAAATAQSTADGKIESFYQTSPPGSASEGDIWFDTDDGNKQYVRVSGVWVVAADTRIGVAITNAAGAQATADGKVTTFYASSAPTATAVGDLWFNTTAGSTRVSRWDGSTWVVQSVLGVGDATVVTQDTYDFAGASAAGTPTDQRTINVTPAETCVINFTATITASGVSPDSGSYLYWTVAAGGGADTTIAICNTNVGGRQPFTGSTSFAATGGVALVFKLISDRPTLNPAMLLYVSSIRIEEIKR